MAIKTPLLVVCGPTASGKTRLAVELAKKLKGEIISADSMQIYRGLNIGTAKPTCEEKAGIPHHMIDILNPDESFSVAQYSTLAHKLISEVHARGCLPIMAGGTGLYIRSVVDNIKFDNMPSNDHIRKELDQIAREQGAEALWKMLDKFDPVLAARLHPNNLGRIIRGIETYRLMGTPLSKLQEQSRSEPSLYQLCIIGLSYKCRETLYDRINSRVDFMMEQGLVEEAKSLLAQGYNSTAFQAIGYKEFIPFFKGELPLDKTIENLKMQTRRYAKRQLTWFHRDSRINWFEVDSYSSAEQLAENVLDLVLTELHIEKRRLNAE